MITVLVLGLSIAAIVVVIFGAAILLRSGLHAEREIPDPLLAWRPSFIHGDALRNWAAFRAEELARGELDIERRRDTAVRLVTTLDNAAGHALLPLARPAELERVIACPAHGQGLVGINAPEVITIAERLRRQKSKRELHRIQMLAAENARQLAEQPGANHATLSCPLQGTDGICCVYEARPLRCRPAHAKSIATGMGPRSAHFTAGPSDETESYEQTIAEGVEIGFTRALESAGLDATVYELNSALAKALETPDAAERWARGENIFAGCRRARG